MFTLIANSGLHFKTIQIDLKTEEPLMLEGGKTLKYTCLETIDFLNDCRVRFDLCSPFDGKYVPVNHAKENDLQDVAANGCVLLDHNGVPRLKKDTVLALTESYNPEDDDDSQLLININSLVSFRLRKGQETFTGFELLLGKWLPMPMYELEKGVSTGYPNGWCRVKIDPIGERGKNGVQTFRFTWAFDTKLGADAEEGIMRPTFLSGSNEKKTFAICNRPDVLLGRFLNIPDGRNDAPVGDYIASLLGIDLAADVPQKYKFLAYYIYLINYIRLCGAAPEVVMYHKPADTEIPVDMSVDIGNSRTCAMLFERGDFTKARELRLRDLTYPWRTYENPFDMRIVFRKADFGGDLTQDKSLFLWPSLVRVGEEAKHLMYRGREMTGESERTTNYSSPKRYLWDDNKFSQRWELMTTEDDPTNLQVSNKIFMEGLTEFFDSEGRFQEGSKEFDLSMLGSPDEQCRYSRQSLNTFVMVEMLLQAMSYINSNKFRDMHEMIDCRRYLRNIIITCPTAMPIKEQMALRMAALNATKILRATDPTLPEINIIPDVDKLKPTDDFEKIRKRGWLYDEAMACQLVYLYAELHERYNGQVKQFFERKGHVRKDLQEKGFEGKSLTIGTIDIGAGTTDVMIATYGRKGDGRLTPIPHYYDSFYSAGDDIVHNIVRDMILEGPNNNSKDMGSISSALTARVLEMTPDQLLEIPRIKETKAYRDAVENIRNAFDEDEAQKLKKHLIHELMHHFFGPNSANQSGKDRRCRLDFCTLVSIPMAQFFLELLSKERPMRTYTFDELFPKEKPVKFLLDHFEHHFGFRFEDLVWRYDPEYIGYIVRTTMEALIKSLSVVLYAFNCDVVVLSGRPTSLNPITELFIKYIPIAPHKLVLLNKYRVGRWYPLSTEEGYFREGQKAVVAVGAEVGYQASTTGFNGLVLDFSDLGRDMKSTAKYMGNFDDDLLEVKESYLTPDTNTATLRGISAFPYYIGCKQFNAPKYQGRPIYAIYNYSDSPQLNIMLQRNYFEDRETLVIEDVTDMEGNDVNRKKVKLQLQTLADDGNFWMDKGSFILRIQEN